MKIGILCYPTYGGSGIVATELGMSLAKKGYEVHFISSELPARLDMTDPNIFFHKVNVQTYPLFKHQPFDIALSSTIYQVVKLYKLDILTQAVVEVTETDVNKAIEYFNEIQKELTKLECNNV